MSQVLATPVNSVPATKTMMTFNCKVCGREMLKVWGNPNLPERVKCPHCQSTYRVRANPTPRSCPKPYPQVSKGALFATALIPALATALFGGFIVGAYPEPGDSVKVKMKKAGALAGTFAAGGFIGLTAAVIATEKIA